MSLPKITAPLACATSDCIPRRYVLQDALAQYSLPNAHQDSLRKVAWTNMLCSCVLAAGLLGVQTPVQVMMNLSREERVLVPIEEIQSPSPIRQAFQPADQSQPAEPDTQPLEPPAVAPSVAPTTAQVNFAIPVEGPTTIVRDILKGAPPTRNPTLTTAAITAPQAAPVQPAKPVKSAGPAGPAKFSQGSFRGEFPDMQFENFSKEFRNRNRGKALSARIQWDLTPAGAATNFVVLKASGVPEFEREIIRWMKRKYRFDPPGQPFVLFQDIEQSN